MWKRQITNNFLSFSAIKSWAQVIPMWKVGWNCENFQLNGINDNNCISLEGKPAPDIFLVAASRFQDAPDPANVSDLMIDMYNGDILNIIDKFLVPGVWRRTKWSESSKVSRNASCDGPRLSRDRRTEKGRNSCPKNAQRFPTWIIWIAEIWEWTLNWKQIATLYNYFLPRSTIFSQSFFTNHY